MADQAVEKVDATAPAAEAPVASAPDATADKGETAADGDAKPEGDAAGKEAQPAEEQMDVDSAKKAEEPAADAENTEQATEKPAADGESEAKNGTAGEAAAEEAPAANAAATDTPSSKNKNRRKSAGGDAKGKTLNKKASKAKITHRDAKPGDHFLVKLKGFPAWPAVVCSESMLPHALVTTRPVTAAKEDGTYNDNYADGGKRVNDRTFPVMYLHTNEFGWVSNTAFTELTPEKARDSINDKMRKDLKSAFELAAEHNSVEHYESMLKKFQEELIALQEAEKAAAATPKKSKKAKADEDEDVEMADVGESAKSKSKKRKADEDAATPQRSDSVKKPKIKLNTSSTPKAAANNADAAKSKGESASKAAKPKAAKKAKDGSEKAKKSEAKEAKLSPEERHARRSKEVMYLRHKLQRGLLTRDRPPQESEMKSMSEFIEILEKFPDLEVSIIRATKINKVLKAILKLDSIPKEETFKFKSRSQALLDKWNQLLEGDSGPSAATNGVNGEKKAAANSAKDATDAKTEAEEPEAGAEAEETKPADEENKAEEPVKSEANADKPETAATTTDAVEVTA